MTKKTKALIFFWISFAIFITTAIASYATVRIVSPLSQGESERNFQIYLKADELFYQAIEHTLAQNEWKPGSSNIKFRFYQDGVMVATNVEAGVALDRTMTHEDYYINDEETTDFRFDYAFRGLVYDDGLKEQFVLIDRVIEIRTTLYVVLGISTLMVFVASIIMLKFIGVRKDGTLAVTFIERIPLEIVLGALFLSASVLCRLWGYWYYYGGMTWLVSAIASIVSIRSIIVRYNGKMLYKTSLIHMVQDLFNHSFDNNIGLVSATVVGAVYTIFLIVIAGWGGLIMSAAYWGVFLMVARAWLKYSQDVKLLQSISTQIRMGDYHQVLPDLAAKDLNIIKENMAELQEGLSLAVEKQLKSERTKSELITNVSHDLKTPLTSILNYVDLLKHEDLNETQTDYVSILDKQVARLRKLTDDLFDAAKISTQDVSIERSPMNLKVFWEQCVAEYDDRFEARGLSLVTNIEAVDLEVMADGQYFWRVIDNLLRNLELYSLENTRIYVDGKVERDHAQLAIKNISKHQLNVSEEALMERFVRGDESRHTEGSGLGLSIARSIMKMLKGDFEVTIDGDLFKVVLSIPLAK